MSDASSADPLAKVSRYGKAREARNCRVLNCCSMAPRTRPHPAKLSPDVETHVHEAVEESEREGYADLTREETRRYVETSELPEHVETWLASCASRRGT